MKLSIIKYFWSNLNGHYKKFFVFLFILVLVGSLAEMVSVGIILPAFSIIFESSETNIFLRNDFINNIKLNYSKLEIIFYLSILIIFIFFLKSILLTLLYKFQTSFCYGVQEYISNKLFKKYLFSTSIINNKKKSAELIRNLTSEMDQMVTSFLLPFLNFFVEIFIFFSIIIVLLYFEFQVSIIIFLFSLLAIFIFYFLTKKKIDNISYERQINEEKKIKTIQDTFGSIRDLIILGCRNFSYDYFSAKTKSVSSSKRKIEFLNFLPKIWIEFFGVLLIVMITFLMIYMEKDLNSFLPTLALFAVAAFRILPITNRLIISIQHMRYGEPVVKNLIFNLNEKIENDYLKDNSENENNIELDSIKIKNLGFKYNSSNEFLFNNINLEIKRGDKIGILGESGSGKSTFVDLLIGFLKPSTGEILINNNQKNSNLLNLASNIGYVPQNVYIIDGTIEENIALNTKKKDKDKINNLIEFCLLSNLSNDLKKKQTLNLGEKGSTLSGGQKQRIAIARSLYQNPKLLILDEATNALDEEMEEKLMDNLFNQSNIETIIIINHRKSSLKNCNKFFELDNKKIIQTNKI